jgi:hypothetical protein
VIRLFTEIINANDHCNVDGPIKKIYRSFEIIHPELEAILRGNPSQFTTGSVIGAEIIEESR